MPHRRSTSCYAWSTPSVYTTCLACVRLADADHHRGGTASAGSGRIAAPCPPGVSDRGYDLQRAATAARQQEHRPRPTRRVGDARTYAPVAREPAGAGSRRRKWRAGCAGPGRARGSRLGVRLRVGSPDSARGGTARTTTPPTRENRESRRRLADLEIPGGFGTISESNDAGRLLPATDADSHQREL